MKKRILYLRILLTSVLLIVTSGGAAFAAPVQEETVTKIVVQSEVSTLVLEFDSPISTAKANALESEYGMSTSMQARASTPSIFCDDELFDYDGNGEFHLQYVCRYRQFRWDFKISKKVQAIIVGNVTERGLCYWINSKKQPCNAPHVEAKSYFYHGTMSGIDRNEVVDYNDYLSFRHNVGSGGKGSITWAGSLKALQL